MRVVYKAIREVVKISKNKLKVITGAVQGPDAIPPTTYSAHMENMNNPHQVGFFQLLIPSGKAGKWIRFSDDGASLIAVNAPLTTMPVLPQPVDELIKTDPADPDASFMEDKVSGILYIDNENHVVRMSGVVASSYPPNYYYGTNDEGQMGFWPLPSSLLPVCGIGEEDEEEWLNFGAVDFFDLP